MKLNYSNSALVSLIITHIIFILIFIIQSSSHIQASDHEDDINLYEISPENRKIFVEKVKTNLLKLLGLKEAPKKPHNIAVVPKAMLEEYRNLRDTVRDIIPDDRDFYGKINIHDIEKRHADFWTAIHSTYGAYDIEVDMGDESIGNMGFLYRGDAKVIAQVKLQNEPEDVPKKYDHILPPHSSNLKSNYKKFISVHLKFNLSQELSEDMITAENFKAGELHLSRERVFDCEFNNCDKKPVPFTSQKEGNITDDNEKTRTKEIGSASEVGDNRDDGGGYIDRQMKDKKESEVKNSSPKNSRTNSRPRYQRLYLLHVVGYDSHDEPITRIHDSQLLDTQQSSPLRFDITHILKSWLLYPTKNYGIIVRVTNVDIEEEKIKKSVSSVVDLDLHGAISNASPLEVNNEQLIAVEDHVRLKRGFHSASERNETWLLKQPSIYVFAGNPLEAVRNHVKREHSADDLDEMQADQPNEAAASEVVTSNPVQYSDQKAEDSHKVETTPSYSSTHPSSPSFKNPAGPNNNQQTAIGKRESRQTSRQIGASNRATTIGNSQQRSRGKNKSARTVEKCSMRTLQINFDEVGWSSWIIAPTSFYANYCSGDCSYPMSDNQNATNHAIIQSIYNSVGRVVPRACCAPNKLANMAILYQLDGVVQMRHYDDMIVQSCGCQ